MKPSPTRLFLATVALGAVVAVGCGSSKKATSSSTTAPTTTSTVPATSSSTAATTTTVPTTAQPDTAVWPFASSKTRYTDPVAAAKGFAVDYLGFVDPVVGAFRQGDTRSGEVEVRPEAQGPVTTVLVRQVTSDNSWWVLGAGTPNIVLQSPAALASISSPVTLSGKSTAYEATVNVEIRQDGSLTPLDSDVVMGGSMGQMGPFSKSVSFTTPTAHRGAIVLKTLSAKDGHIAEASVVRVAFS